MSNKCDIPKLEIGEQKLITLQQTQMRIEFIDSCNCGILSNPETKSCCDHKGLNRKYHHL